MWSSMEDHWDERSDGKEKLVGIWAIQKLHNISVQIQGMHNED